MQTQTVGQTVIAATHSPVTGDPETDEHEKSNLGEMVRLLTHVSGPENSSHSCSINFGAINACPLLSEVVACPGLKLC